MPKNLPIYIILGVIGLIAFYAGITEKKIMFISSPRSAVIVLTILGFMMCSLGNLGVFINKAPAHPFTITGYVLGVLALLAGIVQLFRINLPFFSDPKSALFFIAAVIFTKFIIGRLSFLLPV